MLERVCESLTDQESSRSRAWTLTGAYGSGKSAFALFLGNLIRPTGEQSSTAARRILQDQAPEIHREFFDKRRRNGLADLGLCSVFVSGSTEPIIDRLLASSVVEFSRIRILRNRSSDLERLEILHKRRLAGKNVDLVDVVECLKGISNHLCRSGHSAGVVIVIDELGKFLEYAARVPDRGDIFVLQQLAEATGPTSGLAIITILHQAFDRYASTLRASMRDEWAKVQGRFTDVAFQEPSEQWLLLIGSAIRHSEDSVSENLRQRARKFAEQAWQLGLSPSGLNQREFVRCMVNCAPLHPATVLVLARLCKKFGQNQRSLFAFLASQEPHSFASFLEVDNRESHFYRLPGLYDYVANNFGAGLSVGENATRWAEVQSALDRSARASAQEIQVIKTVGLLTATGVSGDLKASGAMIEFALGGDPRGARSAIQSLVGSSVLVFRKHSDSFALWQGSDVDIEVRSREARRKLDASLMSSKVNFGFQPRPIIAKRHSYQTGTLRYFDVRFATCEEFWSSLTRSADADGLILYALPNDEADHRQLTELACASAVRERPDVVVAIPKDIEQLRDAVRELEVLNWISSNTPELAGDAVGRRELRSRKTIAETRVATEITNLFSPDSAVAAKTAWYHRGIIQQVKGARNLAAFLSDICDFVYSETPQLKNELINRRYLSSAAAAARRNLIERMIAHNSEALLGITGNPPEMSMYASVLQASGIHRQRDEAWSFGSPLPNSSLANVWTAFEQFFLECELRRRSVTELFEMLQRPPYGLKLGLIPVLFCAALVAHDTEIAIYEMDGFVPELSVEMFERLLRNPERFKIRRYNIIGVRRDVFQKFAALLSKNEGSDQPSVVAVVRPLFRFLSRLPEYTRQTRGLSTRALNVREALFATREPDSLLFDELPQACGYPVFTPSASGAHLQDFFAQLQGALGELQRTYDELLSDLERLLFAAFRLTQGEERAVLRFRAKQVFDHAVDPRLKAFSHHLCDEDLDDVLWIEAIATLIVGKPPKAWNDPDRAKYEVLLTDLVRSFRHVEALVFELAHQQDSAGAPAEIVRIGVTDAHSKDVEAVVAVQVSQREKLAKTVFELEGCLEKLGVSSDANLSLGALAVVCRKLLNELLTERGSLPVKASATSEGVPEKSHD